MATSTTTILDTSVKSALKKTTNKRIGNWQAPAGMFMLVGSKPVVAASFDVVGDLIDLLEFPPNTYLWAASVTADKEFDTGGSALRMELVLNDQAASTYTTAVGGAGANQPANDAVEVLSSSAADTTQIATVVGTTQATETVVVQTIALNGTTPVASAKTDWGHIFSITLSAACVGTVTLQEASADADIITLAPGVLSKGVNAVTTAAQSTFGRKVDITASGASTKIIAIKGTDNDGATIYDAQGLTGATTIQSNLSFTTITEVYTLDVENTVTVTVSSSEQLLVADSQAFTGLALPLNFTGAVVDGSELGANVGDQILSLRIAVAPTTANTGTVTFTYKALVYYGPVSQLT